MRRYKKVITLDDEEKSSSRKAAAVVLTKPQPGLNPRQKSQIKRMVSRRQELKYVDTNMGTNATVATIGRYYLLTTVGQGVTDLTRVGDSLNLCGSIDLRGSLTIQLDQNVSSRCFVRCLIIQDCDYWDFGTGFPTLAQIFNNGYTGAPDWTSMLNHDLRHRFHVLYDKTYKLANNYVAGQGLNPQVSVILNNRILLSKLPVNRKEVSYLAGTNNNMKNGIFALFLSDIPAGNQPPWLNATTRIVFRDS